MARSFSGRGPQWPGPARDAPTSRAGLGAAAVLLLVHLAYWYNAPHMAAGTRLSAGQLQLRLDPNRASAAELELLPRIGPAIAQQIVAYRESVHDGPAFRASADLDRVRYVGPATVEQLRPFLRFPGTRDEPAGQHASP